MEFITCLIWASDGFLPMERNMALIIFSLIGGFFWSCLLKNHLEAKKAITAPTMKARMI